MGADTEVIGASGLQQHLERYHKRGAIAAQTKEMKNRMTEATKAKKSAGLVTGTISRQTRIRDGWESNEVEEENALDGNERKTEELNDDEICSLFGIGGKRKKNQKDRTNIITRSTIKAIEKDENGSAIDEDEELIRQRSIESFKRRTEDVNNKGPGCHV